MPDQTPIKKRYYSIGEVSRNLRIPASTLRFWEDRFDEIAPRKDQKGNRRYTEKDIEQLRFIRHLLKEKGYTIQGAQEHLRHQTEPHADSVEAEALLLKLRTFLEELRKRL